jgi:UDP-glucuronate 4-epimerase
MSKRVLVTGSAGFIGAALCQRLLHEGHTILGIDNLNSYYDPALKKARVKNLGSHFEQLEFDIADKESFDKVYCGFKPDRVLHMAAQAGVQHSLKAPQSYVDSNVTGFLNVLEACRNFGTDHLVYASSSSVYGANTRMPFSEHHATEHPVSLYAATKKSCEMMAHVYSHLHQIPTTGLRFFTVYGPWGRPDMAVYMFTKKILSGEKIYVNNHGRHMRDFTYIDDIVEGVLRVASNRACTDRTWSGDSPDSATSRAPYRIYNIGNHSPVPLIDFISTLEEVIGKKANLEMRELQPGDVPDTFADVRDLERDMDFKPKTSLHEGLIKFYEWYQDFHSNRLTMERQTLRHFQQLDT